MDITGSYIRGNVRSDYSDTRIKKNIESSLFKWLNTGGEEKEKLGDRWLNGNLRFPSYSWK